jgi:hypothetical protein
MFRFSLGSRERRGLDVRGCDVEAWGAKEKYELLAAFAQSCSSPKQIDLR